MKIKITKLKENVKIPTRSHSADAGLDCYALEDFKLLSAYKIVNETRFTGEYFIPDVNIQNKKLVYKVPLGFALDIPNGCVGYIKPRSSMNAKGIITYEGVIDSGYEGEISALFTNLNDTPVQIHRGDKICQIVIQDIKLPDLIEEDNEEKRGNGGFGSTGE